MFTDEDDRATQVSPTPLEQWGQRLWRMAVPWLNETDAGRTVPDGREREGPICNELAMISPSGKEEKVA